MSDLRLDSVRAVRSAAESAQALFVDVRHEAIQQLANAKRAVPALLVEVKAEARHSVRSANAESRVLLGVVMEGAGTDAKRSRENGDRAFHEIGINAKKVLTAGAMRADALMREIAGQGPEKTLARGFAIVRDADGATVTRAGAVSQGEVFEIQLRDGRFAANAAAGNLRDATWLLAPPPPLFLFAKPIVCCKSMPRRFEIRTSPTSTIY